MPYYPIDGLPDQIQKSNGSFAANYYLKFYAAGTSTPISVAPNAAAVDDNDQPLLLDKVRINETGRPVNPSGGEIVPHLDQAYKVALYKNAADANADNTSAADWVVDNLSPGLIGFALTQNDQDATEIDYLADGTATTRKLDLRLKERKSVLDFAADNTGAVDCTTAFATALLAGRDIFVPSGVYLMSGIKVLRDGQNIHFGPYVDLKAASNDNIMFWQTSSSCRHTGSFFVDHNGKSGVWGMCVGPADLTSTVALSYQTNNTLPGIEAGGGEEVVVLQSGPDVGGTKSLCKYNYFPLIQSEAAARVLYFKPPSNAAADLVSHNVFSNVVANGLPVNTGVDITSGSHNIILSLTCNGVQANGSPNTTATGLIVDNTCPTTGSSNEYNSIMSGAFISCNRDIQNGNDTTYLPPGVDFSISNSSFSKRPVLAATCTEPLKMYAGIVNSAGTSLHSPPGWSGARDSLGRYTVTHNLGSSDYSVTVSNVSDGSINIAVSGYSSNTFTVACRPNTSTAFIDAGFFYQVAKW